MTDEMYPWELIDEKNSTVACELGGKVVFVNGVFEPDDDEAGTAGSGGVGELLGRQRDEAGHEKEQLKGALAVVRGRARCALGEGPFEADVGGDVDGPAEGVKEGQKLG